MMTSINDLSLAKGLTAKVEDACAGLETGEAPILDHVSEITAELLKWWFQTEFQDARTFNFHPGPVNGFWQHSDWLGCRDGKFRPVEPGTFPLVDGASARVGRLRGYGNAINAEAAKAFIEAVMEI